MTAPRIITAADLQGMKFPEPRWAVPGLVPEGLTVMAGKPKLGKSWLALGVAVAVACGGRVLGDIKVDQGEVLYLALEDSGRRLQSRLSLLLGDGEWPSGLHVAHEWPRSDQGGLDAIAEWLQMHDEARLVTIDTLARFRARRRNGRGYDEDCEDLEPLHQLATNERAALKLLHHTRKMGSLDWIDELSGTLGIAGTADGLMGLFRARGEQEAELKITGRDIEERELGLKFDPNAGTWVLLGEAAETVGLSTERQQAMAALVWFRRPVTARQLAAHMRRPYDPTLKLLQRMRDDGQVTSSREGWCPVSGVRSVRPDSQDVQDTPDTPDTPDTREHIDDDDPDWLLSLEQHQPVDDEIPVESDGRDPCGC